MAKELVLGLILDHLDQIWTATFFFFFFFFKNLSRSVTRYHGQQSCTISEKTNDPILRKLGDGQTDGGTEGQVDE